MTWRASKESGDGRLFFTTNAVVECQVGVGLLRQNHRIDFKVLQGKLDRLDFEIAGPGEIVAVEGEGVVAWSLEKADARTTARGAGLINRSKANSASPSRPKPPWKPCPSPWPGCVCRRWVRSGIPVFSASLRKARCGSNRLI